MNVPCATDRTTKEIDHMAIVHRWWHNVMLKPDQGKVDPTFLDKVTMAACVENTGNCHLSLLHITLLKRAAAPLCKACFENKF
jgi:hypothetical protein